MIAAQSVADFLRRRPLARIRALYAAAQGWRGAALLALTGAVAALAHAPFHLFPALIVGLVGLIWTLDGAARQPRPLRAGFWRAFAFAFGYFLAGTFWVVLAFWNRGPAWVLLAPFAQGIGVAWLALPWAAAGALQARYAGRGASRALVLALLLFAAETLRGLGDFAFPWNLPAHVWAGGGAISQSASVIGASGLSLLTLIAFCTPAALVGRGAAAQRVAPVFAALLVFAGLYAGGARRLDAAVETLEPGVRLRIVQAAISQRDKWAEGNEEAVRDRYLALTAQPGLSEVTHVLWPEGALPLYLLEDGATLSGLSVRLRDGAVLLAGTATRREDETGRVRYYNSVTALAFPDGRPRLTGLYDKVRLVPFGEYIPLSGVIDAFGVSSLSQMVEGYSPGIGAVTIAIPGAPPVAPLICYEIVFPRFAPRGGERPGWLLNLSNDSWFGPTAGPRQHLNIARYRAIEEGLPVARAASGGLSGVIDPWGRARFLVEPDAEGAFDAPLPVALEPTFFARRGAMGAAGIFLIALIAGLGWRYSDRRQAQKTAQA